jgi:hypothetical protein
MGLYNPIFRQVRENLQVLRYLSVRFARIPLALRSQMMDENQGSHMVSSPVCSVGGVMPIVELKSKSSY